MSWRCTATARNRGIGGARRRRSSAARGFTRARALAGGLEGNASGHTVEELRVCCPAGATIIGAYERQHPAPRRHLHRAVERRRPATLRNLGRFEARDGGDLAGPRGLDKPRPRAPRSRRMSERIELQPIDPQTNGLSWSTGCATTHVTKPTRSKTYPDRSATGLWEPATRHRRGTADDPRGRDRRWPSAAADATSLNSSRRAGSRPSASARCRSSNTRSGTVEFRIKVTINADGSSQSYDEDTVLLTAWSDEPFPPHRPQHAHSAIGELTLEPLLARGA